MSDSLLNTSIANLRTELLAAIPSATPAELMNIARSAKGLGLGQDSAIETAVNSRANTLTNTATAADIIKISGAVKQMLQPPSSGGGGSATDLTAVATNIIPDTDITYDLGSTTHKFKDLYLDGSTLNLGNQTIKATATGIEVPELKIGTGTNTVKLTVASDGKLTTTETDSSGNTSSPAAAGGGSSVTVSDTAPTSPSAGDQWFDSSSLIMFVYYADGSSSQWVPATPAGQTGATGAAGSAGSSVTSYPNLASFPSSGNTAGDFGFATDTKAVYIWDGTEWDRIYTDTNAILEWTTEPPATADLASDGTATTQTIAASDPEGFPIEYSYDTNPSNQAQATISNTAGAFTITPSTTAADAGNFILRYKATDGLHSTSRSTTYTLGFSTAIDVSTAASSARMTINANSTTGALSISNGPSGGGDSQDVGVAYAPTAGLKLGKQYIELDLDPIPATSSIFMIGIGDLASAQAGTQGWNSGGQTQVSVYTDNTKFYPFSGVYSTLSALDDNVAHTLMFAYDTTAGRVWIGLDGTWDTSTNTGGGPGTGAGIDISGINFSTGLCFTFGSLVSSTKTITGQFKSGTGQTPTYTVPTGFSTY